MSFKCVVCKQLATKRLSKRKVWKWLSAYLCSKKECIDKWLNE